MKIRFFITLIPLLTFLMCALAARAWISFAPDIPAARINTLRPNNWIESSMIVAQNEPKGPESGTLPTDGNRGQTTDAEREPNEGSSEKEENAGAKPLKPFKPSEEIAAEQAVDYPVDI